MGCCSAPGDEDRSPRAPQRFKNCTDPIFFILFLASLFGGVWVMKQAIARHIPFMAKGVDSFGNVCNTNNSNAKYFQYIDGVEKLGNLEEIASITSNSGFYNRDTTGLSKAYDMRSSDIEYISQNLIALSPALTLCLDTCPGQDLVLTEDQMIALGSYTYAAMKGNVHNKGQLKSLLAQSEYISNEQAAEYVNQLYCSDVISNYQNFEDAEDAVETVEEFCARTPLLLPSAYFGNLCTPHAAIMSAVASAYLNDQDKAEASNSTAADTESYLEGEFRKVQTSFSIMRREVIIALICSVFVAIVIIAVIQVGTKYIVKFLVIGFFICSLAAIIWVWIALHVKQTRMNHNAQIAIKGFPICQAHPNATANSNNQTDARSSSGRFAWNKICNEPAGDAESLKSFRLIVYAVTVICGVMILTICCCWSNIALAVELFDEAGQAVFSMLMILFQPIVTVLFLIVNYAICAYCIFICLQVKERVLVQTGTSTGQVVFTGRNFSWEYAWLFILFNGFWMAVFMDGLHQVSLAGAVANWFFSESREKTLACCPTLNALKMCLRYNLGSVAFGALLIAVVRLLQVIIWIVERQTAPPPGTEMGGFRKCLFACLKCCMACVEKFLAFINRNAYIGLAIFGYDFCRSAQKCLALKVENAGRAATTAIICTGVLFLGKLISTALTLAIFFGFAGKNPAFENLSMFSVVSLSVVVGLVAFVITSVFLSVYEMALDTIFICFCEDQQRNNGKDRPYFSSARLQGFMRKNA